MRADLPVQNSQSSASFPSLHSHQPPCARRRRPAPRSRADRGRGPRRARLAERRTLAAEASRRSTALALPRALHPPAKRGCSSTGISEAFVTPVLEQPAAARIGDVVQQVPRVGPEPREDRQVVRAHEHVHRVDLQQSERACHPTTSAPVTSLVGRGLPNPWACSATRRAAASDRDSTVRFIEAGMIRVRTAARRRGVATSSAPFRKPSPCPPYFTVISLRKQPKGRFRHETHHPERQPGNDGDGPERVDDARPRPRVHRRGHRALRLVPRGRA